MTLIDRGASRLIAAALLWVMAGCAGDRAAQPIVTPRTETDRRMRELDLVVEPAAQDEDLTRLDDATLDRAIAAARKRSNELTGQAFLHASVAESDPSRDAAYRKLLIEMKTAETRLGLLEEEKDRRKPER